MVVKELERPLVKTVRLCQGCASAELTPVIEFGHQPPVHSLLSRDQLDEPEATYPLRLVRCTSCGLAQLGHIVDPRIIFPDEYPYLTGLTGILRSNFRDLAKQARERFGLRPGDLAVDIGSNDGTLLEGFRDFGLRVVGVEPTGIARIANERGIPTIKAFFDELVAQDIVDRHGKARVITGTNVMAHVDDTDAVLRGVATMLADDGVFASESHYLLGLVERLQYDTIYHEHLRYYALRPFVRLLERNGFAAIDAEPVPTHGGSIRVWATRHPGEPPSARLDAMTRAEDKYGLYGDEAFARFRARVVDAKQRTAELLLRLRRDGARVVGVGAPARASMVLNTCHIEPDLVDYVAEQAGSLKIGLYMPGSHVPVVDEERLFEEAPEYALLLSWHIADDITKKMRAKGYRGRFVVPLPEPRILDA